MSKIIAIAGKGGTGKTTIASIVVRVLKEKNKGSVLAIDADPNSNLGEMLGIKDVSSIVSVLDEMAEYPEKTPAGMTKPRYLDMKIQEILDEEEGFDLLSMGRPEGPGCYCFANNLLRDIIKRLINNYDYVVIDNEAGMEHLSRRILGSLDSLIIVSDASAVGVRSAARISKLADELKIKTKEKYLFLNKTKETASQLKKEIENSGLAVKAHLPYDEEIEEASLKLKPVLNFNDNNQVLRKIKEILD